MNRTLLIVVAVVVALIAALVGLWTVQNLDQTAQLSFDLGSGIGLAWEMAEPRPVPYLLLGAMGLGFVVPFVVLYGRVLLLRNKVRGLERKLAFSSDAPPT